MLSRPLQNLSDKDLIEKSKSMVQEELTVICQFLAMINEIEYRRLYAKQGYSSTFNFLVGQYNFSEAQAARRLKAARMMKMYVKIRPFIESGKIHLCGLYLISKHLTEENHIEMVEACVGKSRREIEELLVRLFPEDRDAQRDHVKPVSVPSVFDHSPAKQSENEKVDPSAVSASQATNSGSVIMPQKTRTTEMRISTNLSMEDYDNLMRAKNLLKAENISAVIAHVVSLYLDKADPLKQKISDKASQKSSNDPVSRYIPVNLERAVMQKYNGQCSYVSKEGMRCAETRYLEIDHVLPLAQGGKTEWTNLRILCNTHNHLLARELMGDAFIDQKIRQRRDSTFTGKVI